MTKARSHVDIRSRGERCGGHWPGLADTSINKGCVCCTLLAFDRGPSGLIAALQGLAITPLPMTALSASALAAQASCFKQPALSCPIVLQRVSSIGS